ncbi:cellulose binding domain-containing protein [Cellvibrio sp. UBA7671]|uniref:cellulose binding domain-containing protein n=1 Tax=Cellvibrio sp. UBA7671 TaxID=1946312 RepID=UPI002F36059F
MKNCSPKKRSLIIKSLVAAVAMLSSAAFALSPAVNPWSIQGGKLLDPNGKPFIFRGVTIEHALAPEKTVQAIKDVAALGANAVQVEINANLYNQATLITGNQLSEIIQACKANKVICVLEPNDVAGYPDFANAGIPSTATSFWAWPGIREAILGQQSYIILGFGNQYLSPMSSSEYIARMQSYLSDFGQGSLRSFVIMIDGSGWGQDQNKGMLEFAKQYTNNGIYGPKILYSVEMFDAYTTPEAVQDYIANFAQIGAPLVVGGFAPTSYYHPNNTSPRPAVVYDLPEDAVMHYAEQYGAGYFGWSWSGNQNPALDLANNWDVNNLTAWGNLLFNGANGIKSTAKPASIFVNSSSSSSSSSSIANQNPLAVLEGGVQQVRCGYVNAELSAANSSDPDGDTLTYEWEVYNPYSATNSYFSGPTLAYGMRPVTNYRFTVTVRDGKGGVSTATKTLSHSYSDNCISSSSSSSIIRSSSSSIKPSSSSVPSSVSSSSIRPSSLSSSSRSSSSSLAPTAICSYVVNSQWQNGFTAAIRIKNTGARAINRWSINWQYTDGSKVTNLWNAQLWDSGIPGSYAAGNLDWNAIIQPGQTVEFGFQGTKPPSAAQVPVVRGSPCL